MGNVKYGYKYAIKDFPPNFLDANKVVNRFAPIHKSYLSLREGYI